MIKETFLQQINRLEIEALAFYTETGSSGALEVWETRRKMRRAHEEYLERSECPDCDEKLCNYTIEAEEEVCCACAYHQGLISAQEVCDDCYSNLFNDGWIHR